MGFCRNQEQPLSTPLSTRPFGGITAILPDRILTDEANGKISPEHLIGGMDWLTSSVAQELISAAISLDLTADGSPSTVLMSSCHFAHTILSPRCRASDSVMTVRTPNDSMLSNSRSRPCRTLTGSSLTPVFAPKMHFRCSTVTWTGWFRRDTQEIRHTVPLPCSGS